MFTLPFAVLALSTVLLCSLPSGYILMAIAVDQDPRTAGSRNIGMTNVWRLQGATLGITTLLADLAKGYFCLCWALSVLGPETWPIGLLAATAIISHCYSVFLDFTGGKGVAVAGGVFLAICPQLFFSLLVLWAVTTAATRSPGIGSLCCCIMIIPLVLFIAPQWTWLTVFSALLVAFRHLPNIQQLQNK